MRRRLPVLVLFAAGCSMEARPSADAPTLRVGTNTEITEPSPFARSGLGPTVEELVFERLIRTDPSGRHQGQLAERWNFSPDGRHLTVHLRPGIRFSNGAPLSSRDAIEAFERARHQPAGFVLGGDDVTEVHGVDELTIEMEPARPGSLPESLQLGIAEAGSNESIGSGPYVVASRDESRLVLRANAYYAGPAPGTRTIAFHRFERASDEWSRLLARDVDLVTFVPWGKEDLLKSIPSVREVHSLSNVVMLINFIHPQPPFDSPDAREALSLAIDRGALIDQVMRGHGRPAHGVLSPLSADFDPTVSPYPYDPKEARRRLLGHGVAVGSDGTLELRGKPLALTLAYLDGFTEIEDAALELQRQFAEFGLRIDLQPRSLREAVPLLRGEAPALILRYRHASSDLAFDDEVRRLDARAPGAADTRRLQQRLRDEAPSLYLFWPERLDVVDKHFCGVPRLPDGPEAALQLVHPCGAGEAE